MSSDQQKPEAKDLKKEMDKLQKVAEEYKRCCGKRNKDRAKKHDELMKQCNKLKEFHEEQRAKVKAQKESQKEDKKE